jgi:dUTP pyrophosphatase
MTVQFQKLHADAVVPTKAKAGDAGFDLVAVSEAELVLAKEGQKYTVTPDGPSQIVTGEEDSYGYIRYRLGIAVAIPEGYVGLIFPRSSVSKTDLTLANAVGVVDSGYRGEIEARFRTAPDQATQQHRMDVLSTAGYSFYKKGDRVAQLVIVEAPLFTFEEVDALDATERGTDGFGSSGQ